MGRLKNRLIAKLLTRFPRLLDMSVAKTGAIEVGGIPWTPLLKPLARCKVAIVTTAGVHLSGQEPFDMKDSQGDPTYRVLPSIAPAEDYRITHDYYDHTDADRDINIVFPIDRLKELVRAGAVGAVAENNYGFMGHIDGPHIETLLEKTAPELAGTLKREEVDAALLTPG